MDDNTERDNIPDYAIWDDAQPYREYTPHKKVVDYKSVSAPAQVQPGSPSVPQRPVAPGSPYHSGLRPPVSLSQREKALLQGPVPNGQQAPVQPGRPQGPQRGLNRKLLYGVGVVLLTLLVVLAGSYALWAYTRPVPPLDQAQVATATPRIQPTPTPASTFRSADCPFKPGSGITEGQEVRCGFLVVPEDRSKPQGKKIQLAVAIFKAAPGAKVSSTPLLYLTGGPGGSIISDLGPYITATNRNDFTLGHDFILLDQRGTGFSQPALDCREFSTYQDDTADENLSRDRQRDLYTQAAQRCYDRLVREGVNLAAYTTIANATDVHDLIQALGYKQVNLYGVSYGTRLALTVMRLFPDDLRSVILDSTLPTQSNLFGDLPTVYQHAFDTLFKGCATSTSCNSKHPQLETTFYRLVNRLNAQPITFRDVNYGPISLNGDALTDWVFSALYVTRYIPHIPSVITEIDEGDYSRISELYGRLMFDSGVSYGMYYSVECGEDMAFTSLPALEKAVNTMRPELRSAMLQELRSDYAVCQIWKQKPVPAEQKKPVVSDLPTLILAGEYDPITPSTNGELAMRTLSKSQFFLFPATGHGVLYTGTCSDDLVVAFLKTPVEKPGTTCNTRIPAPNFS
jgi:pimeloyl-ACP methyl ester carboxylesterase